MRFIAVTVTYQVPAPSEETLRDSWDGDVDKLFTHLCTYESDKFWEQHPYVIQDVMLKELPPPLNPRKVSHDSNN